MNKSEYQDEYCGGFGVKKSPGPAPLIACSKSYDIQPVGGRMQAKNKAATGRATGRATGLPVYDGDYVTTVYNEADRGYHRVQPQWNDPKWTPEMRAGNSTLYEPRDRDPPNRNNFYVYKSTLIDPMKTGPVTMPLSVPDVHKLRYMNNNYMTPEDWY